MYGPVVDVRTGKRYRGAAADAAAECAQMGGMLLSDYAAAAGLGKKTVKAMLASGQLQGRIIQKGRLHFYCVLGSPRAY